MSELSRVDDKQVIKSVELHFNNEYTKCSPFNASFDGSDTIKIHTLNRFQDPHQYRASELLFYTDREVYYDEMQYWTDANVANEHLTAISMIQTNDQLPLVKELAEAVVRKRIAPFVGAGMSFACGYPVWGNALRELSIRVDGVDKASFDVAMSKYDYLLASQILWDKDDTQLKNYIRTKFSDGRLPGGKVSGPVLHLPHFCNGCVITTNFDAVVEIVYERKFDGYMHGKQAGNKFVPKLIKGDRCILKLHGDAEDHDSYVFTKCQYDDAYGDPLDFTKPLPKSLRQIFVSHSLLFLGCALEGDKTLELFDNVVQKADFEIPNHFAILPEPTAGSSETKSQKESRLLKLKIHPIWYPEGKFEFVDAYLKLLIDVANGRAGI